MKMKKKKKMGLGDVTNGIGAKFKNWARYVLTKKWLTVINFMNIKKFSSSIKISWIYFQVYFQVYM